MKPVNKDVSQVFDGVAAYYDAVINSYAIRRRVEFFVLRAEGGWLEVGAGTGNILGVFNSKGQKVGGKDFWPGMVGKIKKKGINAVVCDAERLPFLDASF